MYIDEYRCIRQACKKPAFYLEFSTASCRDLGPMSSNHKHPGLTGTMQGTGLQKPHLIFLCTHSKTWLSAVYTAGIMFLSQFILILSS